MQAATETTISACLVKPPHTGLFHYEQKVAGTHVYPSTMYRMCIFFFYLVDVCCKKTLAAMNILGTIVYTCVQLAWCINTYHPRSKMDCIVPTSNLLLACFLDDYFSVLGFLHVEVRMLQILQ